MTCDRCGRANRDGARFCDACGAPLGAGASSPESDDVRKVVTIVFADLAGSTPLQERLDPESARQLMDRYYAVMRAAVDDHHGTVVKLLGDGVMAVFGVPHVAEDDALRAVSAGHEMQARFSEMLEARPALGSDFHLRVGINTGEVVVMAADDDVVGDPVNVAARLQAHAGLGQILVGEPTRRLVDGLVTLEPAGDLQLKGRAELVAAYRLVSLDPPVTRAATRLVGRGPELEQLERSLDAAVAGGASLAMVLGSPGLGKTRLLDEFGRVVGDRVTLLTGHCDAAGLATFAPIAEALRGVTGLGDAVPADAIRRAIAALVPDDEPERDRIVDRAGGLLGAGAPASPEETFWAVRRLLAGLARSRPVVLVLDDLHWAEPQLLDLVEHVVEWSTDVPLLVVGAARPELREVRSSLTSRGGRADVVVLDALDAGAATRLAADVLGADELPAAVAGRVLAASEGNPLFVRELVRMLVDDGVLHRDGERWQATAELAAIEMPPTIHALLASRLERLRPEQRAVIERAAVIGRQFTFAALDHLLAPEVARALDDHLDALRRSELVEADDSWFLGEPVLRFHHALVRDAAYRRLLKGTRAELHERYADWLGDRLDAGTPDRDDTIGWHLEQAHASLMELEQDDEHVRELGRRAAEHLERAGRQALERDDLTVAANLLGRALDRLDADDPGRADLQLERCEALLAAGEVAIARRAVDALAVNAPGDERLAAWHTAFVAQLAILTEPERLPELVESIAPVAEAMRAAGDVSGEAKAHYVHALALSRLGRVGAAETALDLALAAARAAGDRRLANAVLSSAPLAALWGPSPVTRASGRCLDVVRVLRITAGAPAVEAVALRCQAVLEALRGRVDAARRMIASARRTLEELGLTHRLLETEVFAGLVELYDDDPGAAEARLRPAFEQLRARGLGGEAAQAAALLGRALLLQGRDAEADALGHDAEALAGADLKAAIAWRGVQAEAAARRGDTAAALGLARAAVDLAAGTDALLDHADARLVLAAALRAAGDEAAAAGEARRAADLYEAKGATVLAQRAAPAARAAPATRPRPEDAPMSNARGARENRATENSRQIAHAMSVGDHDLLESLFAEGCTYFQHDLGETVDRESHLATLKAAPPGGLADIEILATPSDRLALERVSWWFPSMRVGASTAGEASLVLLVVTEVDEHGRAMWTAGYSVDAMSDAVAALAQRLAAAGIEENTASATMRRSGIALSARDWEAYTDCFAPTCRVTDQRGFTRVDLDVDEFLSSFRTVMDFAEVRATNEILETRGDHLAVSRQYLWGRSPDGGESDFEILSVSQTDDAGRAVRILWLQSDDLEDAHAELERWAAELASSSPRETVTGATFENAATRLEERFVRAWAARDWEAVVATYADGYRWVDRRAITRIELDRDGAIATTRQVFDMSESEWIPTLVATRGERLALYHYRVRFEGRGAGDSEVEMLNLAEVDEAGDAVRRVIFEPDDLHGAHDELAARFALGEGSPVAQILEWEAGMRNAVHARDWELFAAHFEPDFVAVDHRPIGWGELRGTEYIESVKGLAELTPDVAFWTDHVLAIGPCRALTENHNAGSHDGSPFENVILSVTEFTDGARCSRRDIYARSELDAAWARYRELSQPKEIERSGAIDASFENAAVRNNRRYIDAYLMREWDTAVGCLARSFRRVDRRPLVGLEQDFAKSLESMRLVFDMEMSMWTSDQLATRGDRLALFRQRIAFAGAGVAESQLEWLVVLEVDERESAVAAAMFDVEDLDAAYEELDDRFEGMLPGSLAERWRNTRRALETYAAGNIDRLVDALAPDFVLDDHRASGWGRLDRQGWHRHVEELVELAHGARMRFRDVLEFRERATITVNTTTGEMDGGRFEITMITVEEYRPDGRLQQWDFYDLDDLDAARARFAEIEARGGERTSLVRPNSASRAFDATSALFNAREVERYRERCAPSVVFADRQNHLELGIDAWIADARFVTQGVPDVRMSTDLVATAGDRLAVVRANFAGSVVGGGPFATEFLQLIEVDAVGRITAVLKFEPDDRVEAFGEMLRRFSEGEAAGFPAATKLLRDLSHAVLTADWTAWRATLADDFSLHDRRAAGIGTITAPDDWVEAQRVMAELSPDVALTATGVLAIADHGWIVRVRVVGTLADGGPFESDHLDLFTIAGGRISGVELFDADDVAAAQARFEELRPDPLAIPPSAAVRASIRHNQNVAARNWDAVRANCAHTMAFFDRRALSRSSGDRDTWIASVRYVAERSGVRTERAELATAGDRLALKFVRWVDDDPGNELIVDGYSLVEVDEGGLLQRIDTFDAGDRALAFKEMARRFVAGEGAAVSGGQLPVVEFDEAFAARDWEALRAVLAVDFVASDHRPAWKGSAGADEYLESMRTFAELSADVMSETVRILLWGAHGRVAVTRVSGNQQDGGPFENIFVSMFTTDAGKVRRLEVWELEAADAAVAAFEAPRP